MSDAGSDQPIAPEMPFVSIIIPCRNEVGYIEPCLRSALAQDYPPDRMEIIVADGMSDDGTRELLHRFAAEDGRIRVVDNPKRITPAGLNTAIKASRGEVILRMDAHTEYAPDYVRQCVEVLRETGADNVGGPALTKPDSYTGQAVAAAYHSRFAVGGARFHQPAYEGPVDTVTYGCWPREVFERVGLFDEELVRNQDDEHNLRIVRSGGLVWQSPRIRSWYTPRGSLRALFRQYFQYGYWKVRVIQKHRMPASWRHVVPGSFVLSLLALGVSAPFLGWARLGLRLLVSMYAGALLTASVITAARNGWGLLPLLPVVFACYHFAYGLGFLRGMWDFVFVRRAGRPAL
ncbi:MAG: glycosyltransferase family 2 protein [Armatimonadota bacterium]